MPEPRYTHGHNDSVLRSHRWRTAETRPPTCSSTSRRAWTCSTSAVARGPSPRIWRPGVATGRVTVGLDPAPEPIEEWPPSGGGRRAGWTPPPSPCGRRVRPRPAVDDSYDVVHAHQVLQHLGDPAAALREMRRVCGPDGVVAVRVPPTTRPCAGRRRARAPRRLAHPLPRRCPNQSAASPTPAATCSAGPTPPGFADVTWRARRRGASPRPTTGRGGARPGPSGSHPRPWPTSCWSRIWPTGTSSPPSWRRSMHGLTTPMPGSWCRTARSCVASPGEPAHEPDRGDALHDSRARAARRPRPRRPRR